MPQHNDVQISDARDEQLLFEYSIISYGTDFDTEGLVRRLEREDIFVPRFQRGFVWSLNQASRFVESLLLGLPVPGIFLSRDGDSKLLVIDGQQRLRSLYFFFRGVFEPVGKEFALRGLTSRFNGKTYRTLQPDDKRRLNDSIIHATIVRQEYPDDGNSSIYLLFERLNTGGILLEAQEIRTALYHGPFSNLLEELNQNGDWRTLFGKVHSKQRDQELILRFLALYYRDDVYQKPMKKFLNDFMGANRYFDIVSGDEISALFTATTRLINHHLGDKAFKPKRALNAAVLDSIMVGVARNLEHLRNAPQPLSQQYEQLMGSPRYLQAIETGTTDEDTVRQRISAATRAFQW